VVVKPAIGQHQRVDVFDGGRRGEGFGEINRQFLGQPEHGRAAVVVGEPGGDLARLVRAARVIPRMTQQGLDGVLCGLADNIAGGVRSRHVRRSCPTARSRGPPGRGRSERSPPGGDGEARYRRPRMGQRFREPAATRSTTPPASGADPDEPDPDGGGTAGAVSRPGPGP